jgi:DNA-binding MarR family transcriptional regulator
MDINPLSDNEQQLLMEISRRTPGRDSWCPVTDLCKKKTEAAITSLSRSLRKLELQGLVETKTDSHSKSFVRLSDKGYSDNRRLFDVFEMGE